MPLMESSSPGPNGQYLGALAWGLEFLGWRFTLPAKARITHIGGHLCAEHVGTGIFAALVELKAAGPLPAFKISDVATTPDVRASVRFIPSRPSSRMLIPLAAPIELPAGTYGLVFGGADNAAQPPFTPFGVTGTALLPMNNQDHPNSFYFTGNIAGWKSLPAPANNLRFALQWETVAGDQTPPAPPTNLRIS